MAIPVPQTLVVTYTSDVAEARRRAREFATQIAFGTTESEEIALATSELASNLVRHAGGGRLEFRGLQEESRTGLEIESIDQGPGIPDVEEALRDGFSTAGSLGYGLGAVNRLMDRLDINSRQGQGTHLLCRRWVRPAEVSRSSCPLAFGAASRPHPLMDVNGDAFVIKRWGDSALVGVIDGLGHGQFAFLAAQKARDYVQSHYDQPLADIFRGTGRTCRATRGVVMALARFDWAREELTCASVGNVEVRVFGSTKPLNLIVRRGVIGGNAPSAVVTTHEWLPRYRMVMHSDGLITHWRAEDFPQLENESATSSAGAILRALARENDDATVVIVRGEVP